MTNDTIAGSDTAGHAKTAGSDTIVGVGDARLCTGAGSANGGGGGGGRGGGGGGGADAGLATASAHAEALLPMAMLSMLATDAGVATASANAEALLPIAMLSIVAIAKPRSADHMKPAATGPRCIPRGL